MNAINYQSPFGIISIEETRGKISALYLRATTRESPSMMLDRAARWLDEYFAGKEPNPKDLPLGPSGTEFQLKVWNLISQIQPGSTKTYGEIGVEINDGRPCGKFWARPVGTATGKNPLPLIIPCHRVIGCNGLGGFGWGIEIKKWLLRHEGIDLG